MSGSFQRYLQTTVLFFGSPFKIEIKHVFGQYKSTKTPNRKLLQVAWEQLTVNRFSNVSLKRSSCFVCFTLVLGQRGAFDSFPIGLVHKETLPCWKMGTSVCVIIFHCCCLFCSAGKIPGPPCWGRNNDRIVVEQWGGGGYVQQPLLHRSLHHQLVLSPES